MLRSDRSGLNTISVACCRTTAITPPHVHAAWWCKLRACWSCAPVSTSISHTRSRKYKHILTRCVTCLSRNDNHLPHSTWRVHIETRISKRTISISVESKIVRTRLKLSPSIGSSTKQCSCIWRFRVPFDPVRMCVSQAYNFSVSSSCNFDKVAAC